MSSKAPGEVSGLPFFVDTTPYCLWDTDTPAKNLEIVRGLRPDYFSFVTRTLASGLSANAQDAAAIGMALRVLYGHVTETLVALVFASIQAGNCLHAWLDLYGIGQLVSLCKKIESGEAFPTMLAAPLKGWSDFAERLFSNAPMTLQTPEGVSTSRDVVVAGTAKALKSIADDLCSNDARAEYNSYKHGLRVIPAGVAASIYPKDGEPIEVPGSAFGSIVFSTHPAIEGDQINVVVERRFANWDSAQLGRRIHVAVACLDCVRSFLLQDLTLNQEKIRWRFFAKEEDYSSPWIGGPALKAGKLQSLGPPPAGFTLATPEEIHKHYQWPFKQSRRRREKR